MSTMGRYDYKMDMGENSAKGSVVRLVGRGRTVLEVGCASGAMTRCLSQQLDCRVTALEINADDAAEAKPYCDAIHVGNVEKMDVAKTVGAKRFDVAVYADVLEHLRDPVSVLRKTRFVLKDDGYVVACVPNIAHAALTFELALGNFDYRREGLLDDTHIHFFTKSSLFRDFEAAGYAIVHIERSTLAPQFTEFKPEPRNDTEQKLLKALIDAHPESQTYQFIVKAIPVDRELSGLAAATSELQAAVAALDSDLCSERKQRKKLESDLAWLSSRWPFNWLYRLRQLGTR